MKWEIAFWESGKIWLTPYAILFDTRFDGEQVLVYPGFRHDRDSYAINWTEWDPELRKVCACPAPVPHDFLWGHPVFASGRPVNYEQANRIYYDLGHSSTSLFRRISTHWRDTVFQRVPAVRERWDKLIMTDVPTQWRYLYGTSEAAVKARNRAAWRIVTSPRTNRLAVLPPVP